MEFLYFLLAGAVLAYLTLTSNYSYWKKRGIKYIKPIPLFGNTLDMALFRKSSAELFQDFYHSEQLKDEKFGGVYLGRRPCFIVKDLEFIKKVMIKDFQYFCDRGVKFDEKASPLSAHLFNMNGWRWRSLRIKLSPTFTPGKMKMMYSLMKECADGLVKVLEEPARKESIMEMKEPLAQFSTDVIGSCAFGLQFNAMQDPDCKFREMGRRIFKASFWNGIKRTLFMTFPTVARALGIFLVDKDLSNFFRAAVRDTVKHREETNQVRDDFLQLLIELKNKGTVQDTEGNVTNTVSDKEEAEDGKQALEMTDDLLAAQVFIFFIAGFETSSTTMGFALYELALHPEIQEKVANEVTAAADGNHGELTYDLIQGLKYLDMVVSETLRKYPPQGNLIRKVAKLYQIEGTKFSLEPDLRVIIPVYAIHRDPKYYPDPERFDPERFAPEEKSKRHPMTYLPFGDGPRNCIGARFGLLQTKLGLSVLLQRFQFEVCDETPIPPRLEPKGFVTILKGGIMLRIKERSPATPSG